MERTNLLRNVWLFVAGSAWVFLLLSLASFSATDWPSHAVQPYPPIKNLCGSAGAFVAYYLFLFAGLDPARAAAASRVTNFGSAGSFGMGTKFQLICGARSFTAV